MHPIHQAWWLPAGAKYLYFYLRDLAYTMEQEDPWPWFGLMSSQIGEDGDTVKDWVGALVSARAILWRIYQSDEDHFWWDGTKVGPPAVIKYCRSEGYQNFVVWGGPVRLARHPDPVYGLQRRAVFARDKQTCQLCGARAPRVELTVDHIIATTQGGIHAPENWWSLCRPCNSRKGDRPAWLYVQPS